MNNFTTAGPGDPETWGRATGHPHDPRTPEPTEAEAWAEAILVASGELEIAADYARSGKEKEAQEWIDAALATLGENSAAETRKAYALLFEQNGRLRARLVNIAALTQAEDDGQSVLPK